jgi:hypothetical protein
MTVVPGLPSGQDGAGTTAAPEQQDYDCWS